MIKTTILIVGFAPAEAPPIKSLLEEGACVLQAPDFVSGLVHLCGGAVAAVIIDKASRGDFAEELLRQAAARGIPVLEMDGKLDGESVRRRVSRALGGRSSRLLE